MSVDEKREKVLELIYEEMAHKSNYAYDKTLAEMIKALESARQAEKEHELKTAISEKDDANAKADRELKERELELAEKEFELKDTLALTDNANAEMDREARFKELLVNSALTLGNALLWGIIFVGELKATRKFEETGTETSAASRWLKSSFPKVRFF